MAGIEDYGFVRVAAACPAIRLADPKFNAAATIELLRQAEEQGVRVIVFPECGLTGYTCGDLFHQKALTDAAMAGLREIAKYTRGSFGGFAVVGLPMMIENQLYNVAAAISNGSIQLVVPKTYLPNYKEFYDARFFAPGINLQTKKWLCEGDIWFGTNALIEYPKMPGLTIGIEICEDLWAPVPPSSRQAVSGANLLLNLSASDDVVSKAAYRRSLVESQSARCIAGYVYAGCGPGESTGDLVFGGHCLIAENGTILAESRRFSRDGTLTVAEIDLQRIRFDRMQTTTFSDAVRFPGLGQDWEKHWIYGNFVSRADRTGGIDHLPNDDKLTRRIEAHPFVPSGVSQLRERCEEIFAIQVAGLARRLEHVGKPTTAIGVSGGLDSTLALLVLCKALDAIDMKRDTARALTMPGFGTTSRTKTNAVSLMDSLGVPYREIDIRPLALAEMKALGHAPFGIPLGELSVDGLKELLVDLPPQKRNDLTFENVQARLRTSLLMNSGFVIGTGDMSELALGWCTYNADHMSMYNVNVGVPKTLVKFLVTWAAENEFDGETRRVLLDIAATEISPELLPPDREGRSQSTEASVGPYELVDFFLYHFLRYGTPPKKILFLAGHAKFDKPYTPDELKHWLRLFLKRFFANQFKRSCLPDGPKVGSVSLSPRGDWRMPSDAQVTAWLADLD